MRKLCVYIIIGLILASCTGASSQSESTREATEVLPATPAPSDTPEPTSEPSATPMPVENPPAIQLVSASPDTCRNEEEYTNVLGFDAVYHETTTENYVEYVMSDGEGNLIVESDTVGENKDGEEGWGFYPPAYDLPENSHLRIIVQVYLSEDEDAPMTSRSSLTYNCTTGEIIDSDFEQMAE